MHLVAVHPHVRRRALRAPHTRTGALPGTVAAKSPFHLHPHAHGVVDNHVDEDVFGVSSFLSIRKGRISAFVLRSSSKHHQSSLTAGSAAAVAVAVSRAEYP